MEGLSRRHAAMLGGAASLVLLISPAHSAGFALMEQSASGLGNAYAGAGASAEDASTVWWNPAAMSRLPAGKQLAFSLHSIMPSTTFHNGASTSGTGTALNGEGGDAGRSAMTPAGYFVTDLAPRWKFGLGVNVPFGLSTAYDANWIGRFQGIEAKVETLNVNPSVSWALNDTVSLGAGIDWQSAKIGLLTGANYGAGWAGVLAGGVAAGALTAAGAAALSPLAPLGTEGQNRVSLEGDAWGYNLGAHIKLSSATQLGLAYRSSLKYKLTGTTTFTGRPTLAGLPAGAAALGSAFNGATADGSVALTLKTPDSISASVSHWVNDRWQLLGDLTWTGWSKIQSIPLTRDTTGGTLDTLTFNFRDTLRTSFGANYRYSDAWTLRAGYAIDESPVSNAESRTVRLPDNDRQWFSIGAQYRVSRSGTVNLAYAHLVVKDSTINNNQTATGKGLVNGTYNGKVDLLAAQFTYAF